MINIISTFFKTKLDEIYTKILEFLRCNLFLVCLLFIYLKENTILYLFGGCRVRDHIVVGFTTTCAISAYHH
jgi:hypothetical protein